MATQAYTKITYQTEALHGLKGLSQAQPRRITDLIYSAHQLGRRREMNRASKQLPFPLHWPKTALPLAAAEE